MILTCPQCGPRDIGEFTFGGDAGRERPDFGDDRTQTWQRYLFERLNPRGDHTEFWHHEAGCRHWLIVGRNTADHVVVSVRLATEAGA